MLATMQTIAYLRKDDAFERMTRFFTKLFLINFALGLATGIVQEFQFGMNWSSYSAFVGDVFGAPLAMEGLLAFFLESTFLGLWLFGRDRLSPKLHLTCIWVVSIGTMLSAYFILAANSWMQNPVGYEINQATQRPELKNIFAVLFNKVQLVTFPHIIFASLLTASLVIIGVSAHHLLRKRNVEIFKRAAKMGMVVGFVAALGVAFTGHIQAQVMTQVQPMKMAAAEALWETEQPAGWSLFAVGDVKGKRNEINITIPHMLSVLSTDSWDGKVVGINELQAQYSQQYGPGSYIPVVGVSYWTFRMMVYVGFAMMGYCALGLLLIRLKRLEKTRWFLLLALPVMALPFLGTSLGWIFTEMGRQPWSVFGLFKTAQSVSKSVGSWSVLITLVGFSLIYSGLAITDLVLMRRFARVDPPELDPEGSTAQEPTPAIAY